MSRTYFVKPKQKTFRPEEWSQQEGIRLNKYIADSGFCSRRKAEEFILNGEVKVNGEKITTLATKVDPEQDVVEIKQQYLNPEKVERIYMVMHKPRAVITSTFDPENRPTIMEYLPPQVSMRVFPVGRLDYLSEGLLILTNDGEFAQRMMHPKYEVKKRYEVKVFGLVTPKLLDDLRAGIEISGSLHQPQSVQVLEQLPNKTWLEFVLTEGKNREIRKLCEAFGLTVDKLKRVAIAGLSIDSLPVGHIDYYSKREIEEALGLGAFDPIQNKWSLEDKIIAPSSKKPLHKNKLVTRKQEGQRFANEEQFRRFRKEAYYKTLKAEHEEKVAKDVAQQEELIKK